MASETAFTSIRRRLTVSKHRRTSSSSSASSVGSSQSVASANTPPSTPPLGAGVSLPPSPPTLHSASAHSSSPRVRGRVISAPVLIVTDDHTDATATGGLPPRTAPAPPLKDMAQPSVPAAWRQDLLTLARSYKSLAANSDRRSDLDAVVASIADPQVSERQALAVLRAYLDSVHRVQTIQRTARSSHARAEQFGIAL